MFLILELVRGGELFDLISTNSSSKRKNDRGGGAGGGNGSGNELHEVTMRKFFRELASGIAFIHSCGFAHRDLKPEVSRSNFQLSSFVLCSHLWMVSTSLCIFE